MPQVTLKVNVDCYGWNALDIRGMNEGEVMEEMEQAAFDKLQTLREECGVEE